MFRKDSGIEIFQANEGGSFTILSKILFSQDRKNFAGETFFVLENFWNEKSFLQRRGYITIFRRKSFCLTVPKCFVGEHFCVSEKFFSRKFSCVGGGGITVSSNGFLSHRTETKSFVKEPFCFPENFWFWKKFMDKRGQIKTFSRTFYVSQCLKFSWASLKCFIKFAVSKFFMHNKGYDFFPAKNFGLTVRNFFMGILIANAVVLTLLLSFSFEKKDLAVLHWKKQDGRLAPAYFLQEYKFFDRLLLTVKNETTVRNLVNESFLQTSIPSLLSTFYAKKGKPRHFVQIFCLTVPKSYVGEHFGVSENFGYLNFYA